MRVRSVVCAASVVSLVLLAAFLATLAPGVAQPPLPSEVLAGIHVPSLARTGEVRLSDPVSPETVRHGAEVAYDPDHREYLVVWHNQWSPTFSDVYARRVTWDGQPKGSPFAVATGAGTDWRTADKSPTFIFNVWV